MVDLSNDTVNRLKQMREEAGLSQRELAKKCSCSQSLISKIENRGDEHLTVGQLQLYAFGLGYDIHVKFKNQP